MCLILGQCKLRQLLVAGSGLSRKYFVPLLSVLYRCQVWEQIPDARAPASNRGEH